MYLPRLRRINDALMEIKNYDENTCLTHYLIQQLMVEGKITMLKYGNVYVVNLDGLYSFLSTPIKKRGRPKKEVKNEI